MTHFFIAAAVVVINGKQPDKVHVDEIAYATALEDFRKQQAAYTTEHEKLSADVRREYMNVMSMYMLAFTHVEDQCRVIVNDKREEWNLGSRTMPPMDPFTRARTPIDTEEDKAIRLSVAKEHIKKLGPPPPKPSTTYMPYNFAADEKLYAFLIKHSAKVKAFLSGTEGWDNLFFEDDFSLLEGKAFRMWEREEVRLACIASFTFSGVARPVLPSVKEFVRMLNLVYPK